MLKKVKDTTSEPERILFFGFLERVDFPWGVEGDDFQFLEDTEETEIKSFRRRSTNFQFDARVVDGFDENVEDLPEALAYIRVRTTAKKFMKMTGQQKLPEGEWYVLELMQTNGGPRSWTAKADTEVQAPTLPSGGWILNAAQPLAESIEAVLVEDGTDRRILYPDEEIGKKLRKRYFLPADDFPGSDFDIPVPTFTPDRVVAVDVGHGSCVAICSGDDVKAYFDVGFPTKWNLKSKPGLVRPLRPASDCVVVLSHWDYDHYALALQDPSLKQLTWLTPGNINVGPTAYSLSRQLLNRRSIPHGFPLNHASLAVNWGSGSSKNDSGMVCIVTQGHRRILLPADTTYNNLPPGFANDISALTVPHHGAGSKNHHLVPRPTGNGHAVICAGTPNRYSHPNPDILRQHTRQGWRLSATGNVIGSGSRGNVVI